MNLLLALDVLLREESVTVAGEKMGLSAPAMSRTLLRARKLLGDPILVRAGKRLVPTPRALELRGRIQTLADEARSIVQSRQAVSLLRWSVLSPFGPTNRSRRIGNQDHGSIE